MRSKSKQAKYIVATLHDKFKRLHKILCLHSGLQIFIPPICLRSFRDSTRSNSGRQRQYQWRPTAEPGGNLYQPVILPASPTERSQDKGIPVWGDLTLPSRGQRASSYYSLQANALAHLPYGLSFQIAMCLVCGCMCAHTLQHMVLILCMPFCPSVIPFSQLASSEPAKRHTSAS